MTIGPVQMIVLGFGRPMRDEVLDEVERLRAGEQVRLLDALVLYKNAEGDLEAEELGGTGGPRGIAAALIGLDIANGEVVPTADVPLPPDGIEVFDGEEAWDVVAEIPNDSVAALLIVEHRWAAPLGEATARAGGVRVTDGFVSPLDLAEIGLLPAREAQRMHAMEMASPHRP